MKRFFSALQTSHWAVYFSAWILGLVIVGTIFGAILFPLGGLLLHAERSSSILLIRGARFGSFYFLIWAPAIALAATVMRAYRRKNPDADKTV
jgi:hypothetical protein